MGPLLAKQHFEQAGNSADAWQSVSNDLLFAAQVLLERVRAADALAPNQLSVENGHLFPVRLMLTGMALECLLKALWVKQGNQFVEAGAFKSVARAGPHDLVQIAQAVALNPNSFEIDLLRRLSYFIEYGGRYPIPKVSKKLEMISSPGGGKASPMTWSTPSDETLLEKLVLRIEALLS